MNRTFRHRCAFAVAFALSASTAFAVNLPSTLTTGTTYAGTYEVPGTIQSSTTGSPGTVDFDGYVNSGYSNSKLSWLLGTDHKIQYSSSAQIQNNTAGLINARPMEWVGVGADAPEDHVVEFDAGFNADLGTQASKVGGMSTIYFYNTTLITHATQNLPSVWKYTTDKTGVQHDTHHGLLQFYSPYYYSNDSSRSTIWQVRSNDQVSDAGVYWKADLTIDVAAGIAFTSNTYWEQSVEGPHVGFGTQRAQPNTTLTKTGEGRIVIARAGIQGYGSNTTMDIQQGWVEFNSDPTQQEPNYYLQGTSATPTLNITVADGAGVDFNAYTWPDNTNWWSGSGGTHGVNNRHQVASLNAEGTVQVGGLWVPTADSWDQHYQSQMDSIAPETATAGDAYLGILGNLTLGGTAKLDVTLGSETPAFGAVAAAGSASIDGTLKLALEGGYDPALGTVFVVLNSSATSGAFDLIEGVVLGGGKSLAVTYAGDAVHATVARSGDANLDGEVNVVDLGILAGSWMGAADWTTADFNGDGMADVGDLGVIASNWQAGVVGGGAISFEQALRESGIVVPEPAALAMMLVGLMPLMRRRR